MNRLIVWYWCMVLLFGMLLLNSSGLLKSCVVLIVDIMIVKRMVGCRLGSVTWWNCCHWLVLLIVVVL